MRTVDGPRVTRAELRKRKLRHGFKADAKRRGLEVRRSVGLGPLDPLDCFVLAEEMGIVIVRLSDMPPTPHAHHLSVVEPGVLSAATVRRRGRTGVWINDSHGPARQQSSLAHEIAHVVLDHDDAPPLNDAGCRDLHAEVEAEADYFGSALLVPDAAAVAVVRAGTPLGVAAERFGVSEQMMRWRINDSGARIRASRERRIPGRTGASHG